MIDRSLFKEVYQSTRPIYLEQSPEITPCKTASF